MHTEGSGKLNISMQLVATSLDLIISLRNDVCDMADSD